MEKVNDSMLLLVLSDGRIYSNSNSGYKEDSIDSLNDVYTPNLLNGIKCSGLPNHKLAFEISVLVKLL